MLTLEERAILDERCDQFELAWRRGESPRIEAYCSGGPAELGTQLFRELLLLELELVRESGQEPSRVEYLQRFPHERSAVLTAFRRLPSVSISLHEVDADSQAPDEVRSVRCPHCHSGSDVRLASSATSVRCRECGNPFTVVADSDADGVNGVPRVVKGRFELIEQVGAGGFGSVWKAYDYELERTVAVKLPRRPLLESGDSERFLREARAAAQLQHTNLVSVHEAGRDDSSVYIVSEFIHGTPLNRWLENHSPTFRQTAQLCAKLAEALHYAHERGVVHRDLKPANILVDADGEPHVTDFGLARREMGDVTMTMDGVVMGTPAYMSPEQARGEGNRADRRSDVYSLGVVLFQLLTGELPFRGNPRMLLQQVLHDEPPSPRKLNASVPKDLETIALKCLEKDPGKRYVTAQALADDLTRYLEGRPIAARPVGRLEHVRRWCVRNPIYAALLLVIALVTVVGMTGVSWQLRQTLQAEKGRTLAEINSLATAAPESVPDKVRSLDVNDAFVVAGLRKLRNEGNDPGRVRAGLALLAVEPALSADVQQRMLRSSPEEFVALRQVFERIRHSSNGSAQRALDNSAIADGVLEDGTAEDDVRLNAAGLLRRGEEFDRHVEFIARRLVRRAADDPQSFSAYLEMFRHSSPKLIESLESVFDDPSVSMAQRERSAAFLADYLPGDTVRLTALIVKAAPEQFNPLMKSLAQCPPAESTPALRRFIDEYRASRADEDAVFLSDAAAGQLANAAIALAHLGSPAEVISFLATGKDPSLACHLIDRCTKLNVAPEILIAKLREEADASIRYALLLALAGYRADDLQQADTSLGDVACAIYATDPDPGVHAAARRLLDTLGWQSRVRALDAGHGRAADDTRRWYVNPAGQTMVVLTVDVKNAKQGTSKQHRFAIGATEVTFQQLVPFSPPWAESTYDPISDECPAVRVFWSQAAAYCNWLSECEGIPQDQWCYEEVGINQGRPLMDARGDLFELHGYRLPTTWEWEYACRAGSSTDRHFGQGTDLTSEYAWWGLNTRDGRARPVATRRPNRFGLFDMYGNALEWCHNPPPGKPDRRPLRGIGAGDYAPARSSPAGEEEVGLHGNEQVAGGTGFRVARTL